MATYKRTNAGKISARPIPGWRTMTRAQRYNAKMDRIFEAAKETQTRFNESSRVETVNPLADVHDFIQRHGDDHNPPEWLCTIDTGDTEPCESCPKQDCELHPSPADAIDPLLGA